MVGAYFGNPQLGFVLGSLAGSALFPTQLPAGPRMQDTRTTTAALGGPVPIVFGTASVAGTVIWLDLPIEHSTDQSQKGGPEQQTFSYTQSIAIGLCERVDDDADDAIGAIGGVSRIWENGAIVFDVRPQQTASSELNTLAETDLAYANRLTASAVYAETFTLYLGDELQEADPTIEAVLGVGNVPGFRGLAYIVYPNRALTIAQGLRHPNFQFEVFQQGTSHCVDATLYSTDQLFRWSGGGTEDPTSTRNLNLFRVQTFDDNLETADTPPQGYGGYQYFNTDFLSLADAIATLNPYYKVNLEYLGYSSAYGQTYSGPFSVEVQQTSGGVHAPSDYISNQLNRVALYYNWMQPLNGFYTDTERFNALIPVAYPTQVPGASYHQGELGTIGGVVLNSSTPGGGAPFGTPAVAPFPWAAVTSSSYWFFKLDDAVITVTRTPAPPFDPCFGLPPSLEVPGYAITSDGHLIRCGAWTLIPGPYAGNFKCMQKYNAAGGTNVYPWNPTLPSTDPNFNSSSFWTGAYTALVAAGKMTAGLIYGTDYPVTPSAVYSIDQQICEAGGGSVTLAQIIAAVCKRAGLTAIDVSDMSAISINGYPIATVCSGSAIISPLRSVGFFDAVESQGRLTFPARGKPIVATLTENDFGAYDATQNGDPSACPPSITTARSQDEELPRSIRLHYMATSRDYGDGEQDSEFRLSTKATNDVDVTLPMCLDDTQALRCANVLWASAWAGRNAHTLSVDQAWLGLDLADCIGVPVDGVIQRLRLVSDTLASGVLRQLSCVRDGEGAYISFAVASAPAHVPQALSVIVPSTFEFMDLPALQDADSDPGFYVAAQRLNGTGAWKGVNLYKSIDGGATFTLQSSLITEAPFGLLETGIPASAAYTWDDATVIDVIVASSAITFESRTDDAVLAGGNAAAMGADGRWEIVQFCNATQIDATHWQLSRLLRGRRGTEHVLGSSRAGDQFVLISGGDLARILLQQSEIGASRLYKVVSIGLSYTSGVDQPFAGHGQALVPFSPVDLAAAALTGGDLSISWIRRSRLGRTLMSGVDIPLGEATESFQVDILDPSSPASPEVVLRTLASSSESVLYTSAQQLADFGSALPLITIKVAVYQLSAIVGRGTPSIATLTIM